MENQKELFGQPSIFWTLSLSSAYLPCLVSSKDQTLGARVTPGAVLTGHKVPAALSWGDSGDMVRRTPLNWAEPTGELSWRMGLHRFSHSSHMHIPHGKKLVFPSPPHSLATNRMWKQDALVSAPGITAWPGFLNKLISNSHSLCSVWRRI